MYCITHLKKRKKKDKLVESRDIIKQKTQEVIKREKRKSAKTAINPTD